MEVLAETESVCPGCVKEGKTRKIDAKRVKEDGKIYLVKECPEHGEYKSIISTEPEQYEKFRKYWETGKENESVENFDLYDKHYSQSVLTNLFVTNRCDLKCSYCFANAGAEGFVYNPSLEQLKEQMKMAREQEPVPSKAIQLTGGEPAVRDDLPEIIKIADKLGFSHIQVNTNGIRVAEDPEVAKEWGEAGCDTIYMSFDGVTKDVNPWVEQSKKALENFKKAGITSVILVPTVIKGHNDDQLADIIDFAADHIDVVRGVNFQPVSFVGRLDQIDEETKNKERISFSELHRKIEKRTEGKLKVDDWYPPSFVTPISDLIGTVKDEPQVKFGCSPNCGSATYAFLNDEGELAPITRFVDVEGLMEFIEEKSQTEGVLKKAKIGASMLKNIGKYIDDEKSPDEFSIKKLIFNSIMGGDYDSLGKFHYKTLYIGGMWFQDPWNLDMERLKRCVIHYATPEGVIPFCAYNGLGKAHDIRERHSMSIEEWEEKSGKSLKDDLWENGPLTP